MSQRMRSFIHVSLAIPILTHPTEWPNQLAATLPSTSFSSSFATPPSNLAVSRSRYLFRFVSFVRCFLTLAGCRSQRSGTRWPRQVRPREVSSSSSCPTSFDASITPRCTTSAWQFGLIALFSYLGSISSPAWAPRKQHPTRSILTLKC